MTVTKGFITGAATTALDTRKADATKLVTNADGSPRIGVVGANPSIVTSDASTAPMRVAIAAAGFATQRSAGDGAAHWTNDGTIFATVTKPGSQSWIVTVYSKHDDTVAGDADSLPVIGVVTGTAAAIPTVEGVLPAGATKLATVVVPSTATSTQSAGVVITNVYPMTALAGGIVPFRTKAELDAWTTARPGQLADVLADTTSALNGRYRRDPADGAWVGDRGALLAVELTATDGFADAAVRYPQWLIDATRTVDPTGPTVAAWNNGVGVISGLQFNRIGTYSIDAVAALAANITSGTAVIQIVDDATGQILGVGTSGAGNQNLSAHGRFRCTAVGQRVRILVVKTNGNTAANAFRVFVDRIL